MLYVTANGAEVLHGLPTANRTDAKDEKYKSPTQIISSNKIWHQDQQNPSRTQSINWLNVIRLFYSAIIVLELFRICSKSTFFIISTTVADQRLLLVWSIHWLTCFCSASTLEERIKLGHGHWCGSHVGSCLKRLLALTMDWFSPSSWHVEKQKPAISFIWDQSHRTDPHNCLMQLAHVSYHQTEL